MKKVRIVNTVAIACVLAALASCKKKDTTEVTEPVAAPVEKFDIVDTDPFTYVCVEMKGGYEKHGTAISKLNEAVKAQNIEIRGPMFGVYYNSPEENVADLLEWEVGYPAAVAGEVASPLVLKEWKWKEAVSTVYTGPYQTTGDTYKKIFAFLATRTDVEAVGPMPERWLDENPDLVEPDDLKTEIWVPLKKPGEEEKPAEAPAVTEEKPAEEAAAAPEKLAEEEEPTADTPKKGGKKSGGKKGK